VDLDIDKFLARAQGEGVGKACLRLNQVVKQAGNCYSADDSKAKSFSQEEDISMKLGSRLESSEHDIFLSHSTVSHKSFSSKDLNFDLKSSDLSQEEDFYSFQHSVNQEASQKPISKRAELEL
jgi:hypothetical protein